MRVAIGSDHAGFDMKEALKDYLGVLQHEVLDLGTHDRVAVDYPDYAEAVGLAVRRGESRPGHYGLRQRRGRLDSRQQSARHSRRTLPRHLFGSPGRGT